METLKLITVLNFIPIAMSWQLNFHTTVMKRKAVIRDRKQIIASIIKFAILLPLKQLLPGHRSGLWPLAVICIYLDCCIKVTIKQQSICNRMGSSCNFKRSCDNVEIVWEWLESDCGCLETGCLLPGIANFAVKTHLMQKKPTIFPSCKEDATLFLL